jgi:hypothetical protein
MTGRYALAGLLVFAAVAPNAAAPARSNEPFTSFRLVDKQLSIINERTAALKPEAARVDRVRGTREIRAAIGRIRQRSERLAAHYRTRRERFGVKMFSALDHKALALSRSMTAVQRAPNDVERERNLDQFTKATLSLVLQFQAVSSNYGANHCAAGQWACCEPKKDPETNRGPAAGCKWTCVAKPRACSGFAGPRTRGAPSPR